MNRVSLAVALALTTVQGALAGPILQDSQEAGISGFVDFDTPNNTEIRFTGQYGFFLYDYFEVGPRVKVFDNEVYTAWRLGGFAEYNFDTATPWVPFVGVGLDLAGVDVATGFGGEDNVGLALSFNLGVKYFFTDQVALSSALNFEFATDDLYPSRDEVEDSDWNFEMGLRFFFF